MNNPYTSPQVQSQSVSSKPYLESKTKLAKLSWKIPLIGLLFSIAINVFARPIGALGAIAFLVSILIGFVLSFIGIASSFKYSRVAAHAICGFVLNTFLTLAIVAMFHAVSVARDAAIKVREKRAIEGQVDSPNR